MCKRNAASSVLVIIISSADRVVGQHGHLPQAPSVRGPLNNAEFIQILAVSN